MSSKPEVTLEHFYIFNSTYAKKEGEVNCYYYSKIVNVIAIFFNV